MFGPSLRVLNAGRKLFEVFDGRLIGRPVSSFLNILRPKSLEFTWQNVSYSFNLLYTIVNLSDAIIYLIFVNYNMVLMFIAIYNETVVSDDL